MIKTEVIVTENESYASEVVVTVNSLARC